MTGPAALGRMCRTATRQGAMPSRPRGLHERSVAEGGRLAAHESGVPGPPSEDDGHRGVLQRRPQRGTDGQCQEQRREGQEDVHEAHQDIVEPAARCPADEADGDADGERRDDDED